MKVKNLHLPQFLPGIIFKTAGLGLLSILIISCSGGYPAPVNDVSGGPRFIDTGRQHRVNAGETLYAVSWIYDLDYKLLAQVNNLSPPYIVYQGQLLSVDVHGVTLNAESPAVATPVNRRNSQAGSSGGINPIENASDSSRELVQTISSWHWPSAGPVLNRFSSGGNENKGIDIGGKTGDSVLAAVSGEVVYAGQGLLRYGDLIILKHNQRFLSAYAHNSRLLVAEGDNVEQGQKIAELGSTGIDQEMLHFEIRDSGTPVNPLSFLPSRPD